jgi:hypothetical protein
VENEIIIAQEENSLIELIITCIATQIDVITSKNDILKGDLLTEINKKVSILVQIPS